MSHVGLGAGVPLPQGTFAAMSRGGRSPSPPSETLELHSFRGSVWGEEEAVDRLRSPLGGPAIPSASSLGAQPFPVGTTPHPQ